MRIDIRGPLKRQKKNILSPTKSIYARFQYDRLSLFYFLCGWLGHSEGFFPVQILHGNRDLSLEWDLSLQATPRRATVGTIYWLREDGDVFQMDVVRHTAVGNTGNGQVDIQGFFRSNAFKHHTRIHLRLNLSRKQSDTLDEGENMDSNIAPIDEDSPMKVQKRKNDPLPLCPQ